MSNEFFDTVDTLRTKGMRAIKSKSLIQLEDVVNVLSDLVAAAIDLRQQYASLLVQPANVESNEIDTAIEAQIVSSVEILLDESLQEADPEAVTVILRSMAAFISGSLKTRSFAIYRSVLSSLDRAFAIAMTISDKPQKLRIIRLLESRLNISAQMDFEILELNLPEVDLPSLVRFSTMLLRTYQRFLEHVLRSGDGELFRQLLDAFLNTMNFPITHPTHEIFQLRMSLEGHLSDVERREIEAQIGRMEQRKRFYENIAEQKADTTFILGASALLLFERSIIPGQTLGQVMDLIFRGLRTLPQITISFIRTRGEWDLLPLARFNEPTSIIPSRRIHGSAVDVTPPIGFYVFGALSLMRHTDSAETLYEAISTLEVDGGELDYLRQQIESTGPMLLDSAVWTQVPVIHSAEATEEQNITHESPVREPTDRAQDLRRLSQFWLNMVEMQRRSEQQRLVVQSLSDDAIRSFKQELESAWKAHSPLRKMAHELTFYEDLTDQEGPMPERYFGLRQLEPKGWFTGAKGYSASSLGEAFGEGLGQSETTTIFESLVSGLVAQTMTPTDARTALESFLDALTDSEKRTTVILFGGYSGVLDDLEVARLLNWNAEFRDRIHGYRGHFKDVPLIQLGRVTAAPVVIGANMERLGRLTQYRASDRPEATLFDCRVESIDEEKAKALLAENHDLGRPEQNEVLTDPVLVLQSRVLVTFIERFEFRVVDPSAGLRLDITPDLRATGADTDH